MANQTRQFNQSCTVVIPMYNNSPQLSYTLPALFDQVSVTGWVMEIIIVDDGSTDNSEIIARQLCRACPCPYHIISSPHQGAASARNQAVARSASSIIFFLGADIVLRPGSISAHLDLHSRYPNANHAGLGFVIWDPRLPPSPFMEWMAHGGSQNNFDALLGQTLADPQHFFYGSHLSLKRSVLPSPPFRNDYGSYGWEDIDLGRRLAATHHLKLHVLAGAIGLHRHFYSAHQIFSRQRAIGYGFRVFQAQHPSVIKTSVDSRARRLKHLLVHYSGLLFIISQIVNIIGSRWSIPLFYKLAIDSHFWHGFYHTYPHK